MEGQAPAEPESAESEAALAHEPHAEPDSDLRFFEAPTEIVPELVPYGKQPGFFAKLFRRKVKEAELTANKTANETTNESTNETTNETTEPIAFHATAFEEPAPSVEETYSSVEDALPAADSSAVDLPFVSLDQPAASESKPGILSRLFRRSESTKRPSLEIEIHEDRIAAAADALDQAGERTFAEGQELPVGSTDPFASVEEALPEGGGADDERFAPRESRDTIETAEDSQSSLEPEPLDLGRTLDIDRPAEVRHDFGNTLEVEPDLGRTLGMDEDLGSTQEIVPASAKPADDAANADGASYFGDTLDPATFGPPVEEEIEKDTDEFAIPEPPAAPVPDPDVDTARVSRKSLVQSLLFWRAKAKSEGTADPTATLLEAGPAFLFTKFRTFYNEIIRFKHQKTEYTAGFSTAIVTEYAADLSPESAADALSEKLAAMLVLQASEAMWMGGESAERYPEAQYAMAALADETFLHLEWEGQGAWHKNLLEPKLFKTHAADVELFKRIDRLLKDQPNSAAARDLARVYLLVLAAGFRGKYRPFGLTRALAEYRQRLYEYIHEGGDALMIYAADRRLFPDAAGRTLAGEAVSRFTAAQRWAAILTFLVVGYTAIAHVAWSRVSADLKDVTDRIEAGRTATTTP